MGLEQYEDQMLRCFHCQLCLAVCPVYLEDLMETCSARARLGLIHAAFVEGSLPISQRLREVLDRCLLCTRCAQSCPVGIPLDDIFAAARRLVREREKPQTTADEMASAMKQRRLYGLMKKSVSPPEDSQQREEAIHHSPGEPFEERIRDLPAPPAFTRSRVAYYVGCSTNSLYPETGEAVLRVMSRNGIQVVVPEGLVCCGMPAFASGDLDTMVEMLRTNLSILAEQDVDAIITDCTSCGMVLKTKMVQMFSMDNELRHQAEAVSGKIWEATDYLNHMGLTSEPSPLSEPYTYHVPCHAGWSVSVKNAPRKLLQEIPQSRLTEMTSPEICCGAGALFFTEHGELSERIRSHKIEAILETGVKTVVTQCPFCRSYLAAALDKVTVMHPLSFLAKSYGE